MKLPNTFNSTNPDSYCFTYGFASAVAIDHFDIACSFRDTHASESNCRKRQNFFNFILMR